MCVCVCGCVLMSVCGCGHAFVCLYMCIARVYVCVCAWVGMGVDGSTHGSDTGDSCCRNDSSDTEETMVTKETVMTQ